MQFEFLTAGRIVFGCGVIAQLGARAASLGTRALLVTGRATERSARTEQTLRDAGLTVLSVHNTGEPTVEDALSATQQARAHAADVVVGCGGGSALDLAKAVAALSANAEDPFEFLEVIGRGRALPRPALPMIAVPTTAGTGAEVTKNAVLGSKQHGAKVSLRHDSMLPRVALLDPELTVSVPPAVTAATGLDALTQCLEPFLSCQANPLTDGIAREGIRRGAGSLLRAHRDGSDLSARSEMALCSLFGGLALANAKLGAVHGFAAPIGGMFESPHGAVCARLLPLVFETNFRALTAREPQNPALPRFDEVARLLTGNPEARAHDALAFIDQLAAALSIPGLAHYGMTAAHVAEVVNKAQLASSMKGNPITLTREELTRIAERAL